MQRKSISRISMIAIPIMLVCGLLFAASSVRADDEDTKCTNRTLRGDYGFTAEGVLIGTPGLPAQAPFRSVGLAHFDGKGNLTWLEHTVINGILLEADWTAASGSYTVNANCTGTAMVSSPNSPVPLKLAFVIVRDGKEVRSVLDANAIVSVFTKVE
jgi:hypothetical protein